jgi:hypothetical protein
MDQNEQKDKNTKFLAVISLAVTTIAGVGTCINAYSAYNSYNLNKETQGISLRNALFAQFQQEYSSIRGRFPARVLDPSFRPEPGSDEYGRLESYWIFCFAEWYATKKLNAGEFGKLWDSYYSPLIENAMDTPSLRYVLINMIKTYPINRDNWREYFIVLDGLAQKSGHPLDSTLKSRLNSATVQSATVLP